MDRRSEFVSMRLDGSSGTGDLVACPSRLSHSNPLMGASLLEIWRSLTDPERLIHLLSAVMTGWYGYALLAGIVFAETGLLVGLFLPGDSLLFTVGVVTGAGELDIGGSSNAISPERRSRRENSTSSMRGREAKPPSCRKCARRTKML